MVLGSATLHLAEFLSLEVGLRAGKARGHAPFGAPPLPIARFSFVP